MDRDYLIIGFYVLLCFIVLGVLAYFWNNGASEYAFNFWKELR
jgi:uncharacterized membrane protein